MQALQTSTIAARPPQRVYWWLQTGGDAIEDSIPYASRADACAAYKEDADFAVSIGNQPLVGYLRKGTSLDDLTEDFDYLLSLGERGGVRMEAA